MKRTFVAHPRHPLTHKQFAVRAHTQRELEALLHRIDSMKQELRADLITPEEIARRLSRLQFGAVTLSRVAESYQRRPDISPETRRRVRNAMNGPLRELAMREVDALDSRTLSPVFERLGRRLSRESIRTIWRTLTALGLHAADRGWLTREPWAPWHPRAGLGQEGKGLRECARSWPEVAELLAAAHVMDETDVFEDRRPGQYRALEAKIATGAMLGLRHGEIAGLRTYDFYPDRGVVAIRRQWGDEPLKHGESAEVPAPPELFAIVERHLAIVEAAAPSRDALARKGRYVFENAPGEPFPRRGPDVLPPESLRMVVRAAGLPSPERWTTHSLRDSFATIKARECAGDLRTLQRWTRHRSISSLVRYLRTFERLAEGTAPRSLPPAAAAGE